MPRSACWTSGTAHWVSEALADEGVLRTRQQQEFRGRAFAPQSRVGRHGRRSGKTLFDSWQSQPEPKARAIPPRLTKKAAATLQMRCNGPDLLAVLRHVGWDVTSTKTKAFSLLEDSGERSPELPPATRSPRSWMTWCGTSMSPLASSAEEALRNQTRRLETFNRLSKSISTDLDLERTVQTVTDIATELSGAKFGAFFYNVVDGTGERYLLYTISGAPREVFSPLGLPRNTQSSRPLLAAPVSFAPMIFVPIHVMASTPLTSVCQ
jgi:hypothetical protein